MKKKICKNCKDEKELELFNSYEVKLKSGTVSIRYTTNCRTCRNAYLNEKRKNKPLFSRIKTLREKYGLTYKEYEVMLANQNHLCLICEDVMTKPNVDHCHTTGKIRGLLCNSCNVGLGAFKDNPSNLVNASDYLKLHI